MQGILSISHTSRDRRPRRSVLMISSFNSTFPSCHPERIEGSSHKISAVQQQECIDSSLALRMTRGMVVCKSFFAGDAMIIPYAAGVKDLVDTSKVPLTLLPVKWRVKGIW